MKIEQFFTLYTLLVSGGQGTELSVAPLANLYEDSQEWKQTDYNSENLDKSGTSNLWNYRSTMAIAALVGR